ncbi:cytochrome P450 [Kineosporia sp. A_224]|uniref:cytochrome P450 n=1 Tax=Kineosporia sp. A_224 TaxID=1962180 RepID=UPI000B4AADB8|nr:cytochrome P450 [Kineosporia sp. A_224]
MSTVTDVVRFAGGLYAQRAATAWQGYGRRDPMARLMLRPGRVDPYAVYEELRAHGPVAPTRLGNWVTTGHAVTSEALRDRRLGVRALGMPDRTEGIDLSFLERDPPDHTRLRRLAAPAFTPRRMAAYRTRIEQLTHRLVDDAATGGTFDLVAALAAPLPIAVITDLLGVPDADSARFARYGTTIGSALDGIRSLRHARDLMTAQQALTTLLGDLVVRRRTDPGDDVISHLVAHEGDGIEAAELLPLVQLLLVAGFETTVNLVGNAVHALLADRDQWELLRADPGLAAAAVEETLRQDPPVQRTARVAHAPLDLGGVPVRRGQWVVALIGAANRDPAVHPDAARFDLLRTPAVEHLAFSAGIHYCVGAPLARLEGEVALATLAARLDLEPAGRPVRRPGTTIRGMLRLPVRVRVRRG